MKIIVSLVFFVVLITGLNQEPIKNERIPILIDTKDSSVKNQLVIKNNRFRDTVKVVVWTKVFFKYPLSDTTQQILVDSVKVYQIYDFPKQNQKKKKTENYPKEKNLRSSDQEYVWNLCQEKFSAWLPNQPYNKIWDRQEIGSVYGYGRLVFLVPE